MVKVALYAMGYFYMLHAKVLQEPLNVMLVHHLLGLTSAIWGQLGLELPVYAENPRSLLPNVKLSHFVSVAFETAPRAS